MLVYRKKINKVYGNNAFLDRHDRIITDRTILNSIDGLVIPADNESTEIFYEKYLEFKFNTKSPYIKINFQPAITLRIK